MEKLTGLFIKDQLMLRLILLCMIMALANCASPPIAPPPERIANGTAGSISICRPSKIFAHLEQPDFKINGELVGKIGAGREFKVGLNEGDDYEMSLESSLFYERGANRYDRNCI